MRSSLTPLPTGATSPKCREGEAPEPKGDPRLGPLVPQPAEPVCEHFRLAYLYEIVAHGLQASKRHGETPLFDRHLRRCFLRLPLRHLLLPHLRPLQLWRRRHVGAEVLADLL